MTHPFDRLAENLRSGFNAANDARPRLTFLDDGGGATSLTGSEIVAASMTVSRQLQQQTEPGDRVLLAYPPGLEFAAGMLGAIHAGVIPVPVPAPKPRRSTSRFSQVAESCGAKLAMTTASLAGTLAASADGPKWMPTGLEQATPDGRRRIDQQPSIQESGDPGPRPSGRDDGLLFLQYTSGSTSSPKGVMVTIDNLMANLNSIRWGFELDALAPAERVVCGWLPLYHDMGLVGILMSAIVHDGHAVLLSPNDFVRRPAGWLRAIGEYRATMTVAPTFGYRWATEKITEDEAASLDLSSLKLAACGAEPISISVLDAFADRYRPHGFGESSWYPCYGLAEATLMVTGADRRGGGMTVASFDRGALSGGRAVAIDASEAASGDSSDGGVSLVSSGVTDPTTSVRIVAPEDGGVGSEPLGDGRVGEIVVHGPGVAAGYFGDPTATAAAMVGDGSGRRWLRTGDLGFVRDGELFVTGRIKDLIIVAGVNHYPQDIEQTVADVGRQAGGVEALSGLAAAAVSVGGDDGGTVLDGRMPEEGVGVVAEVPRGLEEEQAESLIRAIRISIVGGHELSPATVVLVRPASLPRTSSGKIRRSACGQALRDGTLKIVRRWDRGGGFDAAILRPIPAAMTRPAAGDRLVAFLERCLMRRVASETVGEASSTRPFGEAGLDSLATVQLADEVSLWTGVPLSPVAAWSHPTPRALAEHLAGEIVRRSADTDRDGLDSDDADWLSADVEPADLERLLAEVEGMDEEAVRRELDGGRTPVAED